MLISCAEQPPPLPPVAVAVQPPQQAAPKAPSPVAPHPARKPTPPPSTEGSAAQGPAPETDEEALAMIAPEAGGRALSPSAAPPPPVATPPPVVPPPQAKELIGLDQSAATRLFGAAAERAEEPPATVWRYKTATCELDLFFYLDLRSGRMRTLHYAFSGDTADPAKRQDCLRDLVAARST
jgi:hypothetical protein